MAKKSIRNNFGESLTKKQTLFCKEYLANGYNATQAAIGAGYKKKALMQLE